MKLSHYLKNNNAESLTVTVGGKEIDDVYFRRLSAGEGLTLKNSFADLIQVAGDAIETSEESDLAEVGEKARKRMTPEQLRTLFGFQKLFTLLHLADKDGNRVYTDEKEFDAEVPDEFVEAFYLAGSEHKKQTGQEPTQAEAEKNSETPTT